MVEPREDHLLAGALDVLEVDHHVARVSGGLRHRHIYPVGVPMQVLAQALVVGEDVRRVEADGFSRLQHVRASIPFRVIRAVRRLREVRPRARS